MSQYYSDLDGSPPKYVFTLAPPPRSWNSEPRPRIKYAVHSTLDTFNRMKSVGTVLAVVAFVAILSRNVDGGLGPREGMSQMMELVNAAFTKCKTEIGITEDSAMKYLMSQKDLQGNGCGLACIAKELGYIANEKIDETKIMEDLKKVLPKEEMVPMVQSMIHECVEASSNEKDQCKLVLTYAKCQMSKVKEMKEKLGKIKY